MVTNTVNLSITVFQGIQIVKALTTGCDVAFGV